MYTTDVRQTDVRQHYRLMSHGREHNNNQTRNDKEKTCEIKRENMRTQANSSGEKNMHDASPKKFKSPG